MVNPFPVVHVQPLGNIGNRMLQAMAAVSIARRVERCALSGIHLPEWGLSYPTIAHDGERLERFSGDRLMHLDVERVIRQLRTVAVQRVEIACYAQHLSNFLPVADYRELFPDFLPDVRGAGPEQLLINVRSPEILRTDHPDYTLLPLEFYQDIVRDTGLAPVFMGQTDPNPYMDRLRKAFPGALVLRSMGPVRDFAMIRRSRNILVSISTFSWLAAWLSNAERIILPLSGFFNPVQFPEMDFIPLADPRYEFYLFPINYAVPIERHEPVHRSLIGNWRRITPAGIEAMRRASPEVPVNVQKYWDQLDEAYYLSANADVAAAVARGTCTRAREHYIRHGMNEGRLPLRFDRIWYGMTYPDAAVEVGRGKYLNLLHHYIEIGRSAGYLSAPPPGDPTPPFESRLP